MSTQEKNPTSDVYMAWASTGANGWSVCADSDDATYIYEAVTDYDSYRFGYTAFDISSSAIQSVQVKYRAKVTAAKNFKAILRVGTTSYYSANKALTTDWVDYTSTEWLTNPATSAAWLEADVEGTGANPLVGFGGQAQTLAGQTMYVAKSSIIVTFTEAVSGASIPLLMAAYRRRMVS